MTKKRKQSQAQRDTFKVGDLVGAKLRGFPLWPSYIEEVNFNKNNNPSYTVRFFGSDETSQSCTEIKRFTEFTQKELNYKTTRFKEALEICQKKHNELCGTTENQVIKSPDRKKIKTTHEKNNDRIDKQQSPSIPPPTSSCSSSPPPSQPPPESPKELPSPNELPSIPIKDTPAQLTQPLPDTTSSPQQLATNILAIKIEKKMVPAKKVKKVKIAKTKSTHKKNDSCLKTPNKSTTSNIKPRKTRNPSAKETIHSKDASMEGEEQGENLYVDTDKIFKKLKEKVDKKLEEKEKLKEKERHRKSINKASQKIVTINKILYRFSQILKKISSAKEVESHSESWKTTLASYIKIMPVLQKCTKIILDAYILGLEDYKKDDTLKLNYKQCHSSLVDIVANLKAADKNDQLPADIKEQAQGAKQELKDKFIKKFINEYEFESEELEINMAKQPKRLKKKKIEKNNNIKRAFKAK